MPQCRLQRELRGSWHAGAGAVRWPACVSVKEGEGDRFGWAVCGLCGARVGQRVALAAPLGNSALAHGRPQRTHLAMATHS